MSLDRTDTKIIAVLQEDGSLAYKDVAQKLNMNESTVRKRILALREKQIIKKFSVEVDPNKLGYNTQSMVGIDVEPSRILEVGEKLRKMLEVRSVSTTLGEHAFLVEIWAEDHESLANMIRNKLSAIEGVTKISPSILVDRLK